MRSPVEVLREVLREVEDLPTYESCGPPCNGTHSWDRQETAASMQDKAIAIIEQRIAALEESP